MGHSFCKAPLFLESVEQWLEISRPLQESGTGHCKSRQLNVPANCWKYPYLVVLSLEGEWDSLGKFRANKTCITLFEWLICLHAEPKFKVIKGTDINEGRDAKFYPAFSYPVGTCRHKWRVSAKVASPSPWYRWYELLSPLTTIHH